MRRIARRLALWLVLVALAPLACAPAPETPPPERPAGVASAPGASAAAPAPEQYGILSPPAPPEPHLTCPRVFGVRPGSPVLFRVSAAGERPIALAERGLPAGLAFDPSTGLLTGRLERPGEHRVTLLATSARGRDERELRIVAGTAIALTPPMGWNSWNCWGVTINDEKVRQAADAMAASGLADHGWTYINIDDGWQGDRKPPAYALQPKQKMGDLGALAEYVHARGLKLGLYSTPWKRSYAGYRGGSADTADGKFKDPDTQFGRFTFYAEDARQFAAWGVDYLKYDWKPIDPEHARAMADALRAAGRDIVFSLSNSAPFELAAEWARLANAWRTTGDLGDSWEDVAGIGFSQDRWRPFAGPGHWNDPDMLVVGVVGWGPNLRPTQLTPNEQYTHVSLWCLLAAPLLLGCDLAQLDDFTRGLLVNDEVREVDQDPLGRQAARVSVGGPCEVWAKEMEDGSRAVGLFNRDDREVRTVTVTWADLGLAGPHRVRDLWRRKDLGVFDGKFETRVLVHGVVLVRVSPL